MKFLKRKRVRRLSLEIILTLIAVFIFLNLVVLVIYHIARAVGFYVPESKEGLNLWVRIMLYFFTPIFGFINMGLFAYAINKIVVKRIYILEKATKDVAKGNFDISLEIKGKDELSKLTESFNWMTAELKANEYLSKEFVRNVSHEYKTPISAIRAYGELLEIEAENEEIKPEIRKTLKEYAQIITQECDRLNALSKNAIQISLLDSTTLIKKEDKFKPAEQIREILRFMQVGWLAKNITLDLRLEEFEITSNKQLLYQVWLNLISNAIKFSSDDGNIKLVLYRDENFIFFEISDNGPGIREEDKNKIFTWFFMGDKSRNVDGNGLGLSIVKKIVEKLGGEIGFDSEEGKGSTFKIKLDR